jgi:protein SCO1/2
MQTDPISPVAAPRQAYPTATAGKLSRSLVAAVLAVALVLAAAGGWLGWARLHTYRPFAQQVFADPRPGYNFQLTDQNERPVSLDSFRGKVVLLTFGFTHCPNVCPTTLANLSWALNLLSPAQKALVQVLFISVDPKRDTPERLRGYVPFYNLAFLGASGSVQEIARTAKSYGVFYTPDAPADPAKPDSYNITHSAYVYVIDKTGRWIALYDHDQLPEREKLAADLAYFAGQ